MIRGELLGHYGLTLYRSLARHWLYALLNVMGLAVGITVFLVLMLDVRFETSFDRWIPDAANIYRFTSTYSFPGRAPDVMGMSSGAIAPVLSADYPKTGIVTRMMDSERPVANGSLLGSEHTDYVDLNFFDVLDLPLLSGSKFTALAAPDGVVVTKAVAEKYFGTDLVLGRPLTLFFHGKPYSHRISAVLRDLPANSNLKLGIVAPLTPAMASDPENGLALWGAPTGYTFMRFKSRAEARALAANLPPFVKHRAHDAHQDVGQFLKLSLDPLGTMHFADAGRIWTMKPGVDLRLVYALGLVGALTLIIAILNYVNLATARSALRAKEIALRKVMGATRRALRVQVLAEATVLALVATVLGLALAELALPVVNSLIGATLVLRYWGADGVLIWVVALGVGIGLVSGLYPALLLSRFEAAPVLASARTPGGGRGEARVRAMLIGTQFVVAIAFTICTLVIGSQARFIRDQDRGFHRDGLILLDNLGAVLLEKQQNQILDALRRVPGVASATASLREPGLPSEGLMFVLLPGQKGAPISVSQDVVSDDYLKTYGGQLIAGRMFDRTHGADDIAGPFMGPQAASAKGVDVVINESAARALGFASPAQAVGRRLYTIMLPGAPPGQAVPIIGVIRDMQFGSPKRVVAPVVYRYDSQSFEGGQIGAVRFSGVSDAVMMDRMKAAWRRVAPTVPFLGETAQTSLSDFYVPDEQRARLFTVGSLLAVAISGVGLYGLAAFSTARRFKEIGIRKTLGASTSDVLKLLLTQILRPVLIANLIAWPLAWLAMRNWLAGFDQRIALSPLYFLAASVLALVVASLTVIAQSLSLARAEPAKALRHE
jgi:putative ABC transport system permease protein